MSTSRHETRDSRHDRASCLAATSRVARCASRSPLIWFLTAVFLGISLALIANEALAIDTNRPDVQQFIGEMVQKHHFHRGSLRKLLRDAQSKPKIIETITRPAEQVLPWFEYRARFLTERRVNTGVAFWNQQGKQLERATRETGVSPEVILGILGVETMFGEQTGRYRVLDALVTLGFDYPPRGDFFRGELEEYLLLTRSEKIDPRKALGSYAGAIGAPQFMPSSYRKFAVDGDGNGHRDLWASWPDIVMSVANFLKSNGWRADQPVVVSATLDPSDLAKFDTAKIRLNETVASLREKGARFETDLPSDAGAMLIAVESRDGAEYRVGFQNFIALSRYNPRVKYVLAVHDLGAAIARARADAKR